MTAKICFFRICCTSSLSWYIYCHLGVFLSSKFTQKAQNLADHHQNFVNSMVHILDSLCWSWLARSSAQWCCAVTCHLPTRDRPFMKEFHMKDCRLRFRGHRRKGRRRSRSAG